MKKYCWLCVLASFYLFVVAPIASADSDSSDGEPVSIANVATKQTYNSLRYFHNKRGLDGSGYTRYDGRRFTTGRNATTSSRYSKGATRRSLQNSYGLGSQGQEKATGITASEENYLDGATEYDPRRFYHKNRFKPGFTRYEVRRHSAGDFLRRGGRLYKNTRNREALDNLDYWQNYGQR